MISLFAGMKQNGLFGDYSYRAIAEQTVPYFKFRYTASTVCKKMKQFDKYSDYHAVIQSFITNFKKKAKSADNK